jgi:hypothetical protein
VPPTSTDKPRRGTAAWWQERAELAEAENERLEAELAQLRIRVAEPPATAWGVLLELTRQTARNNVSRNFALGGIFALAFLALAGTIYLADKHPELVWVVRKEEKER